MPEDSSNKGSWRDWFSRASDGSPAGPDRRRFYVRLAFVALAVVVLLVIPGYFASQPSFMRRYEHLHQPYTTWASSVHAKVSCQQCHVAPGPVPQTIYSVRMLGEFYLSLLLPSREPGLLATPTNASCQNCHIDLRTVSPRGDVKIPHRAHVNVLKLQCIQCHRFLVHKTNAAGNHHPTMSTCLKCHDGKTAKNGCPTCHTNKGLPLNHRTKDWIVIHPQKQKEIDCAKCHKWTAKWCVECHSRKPRSHGPKWRTNHRLQVKLHRNCEACHAPAFCIRCHGEVPSANLNPSLKLVK